MTTVSKIKLHVVEPIRDDFTIMDIAEKSAPGSWLNVFEQANDELKDISEIVGEQEAKYGRIFPNKQDIFAAFQLTKLSDVKVVLVGQDPYHSTNPQGNPVAMGLSFSVRRGEKVPPSLLNIYTELENSVPGFKRPLHGDLSKWAAKEGVLLLNSALSVNAGMPGSHGKYGWVLSSHIIEAVIEHNPKCIFILWGKFAQSLESLIGERSHILKAATLVPSPPKEVFLVVAIFELSTNYSKVG